MSAPATHDIDVLVIGAGLSGVNAAYRIQEHCPDLSYDYESPHDPGFAGTDSFAGTLVHPQFWPQDLDFRGRRVAVIGSGATAITLVPALPAGGAAVTMVQRTPTYVLAQRRQDPVADVLRRVLSTQVAHQVMRVKNTALQWVLYQVCRRAPGMMRRLLRSAAVSQVGRAEVVDAHLSPPYAPWDQRLCIALAQNVVRDALVDQPCCSGRRT